MRLFDTKKKKTVAAAAVVAMVVVAVAAILIFINTPEQRYNRYLKDAQEIFEKGFYEEAAEAYGKAFDVGGNMEALADIIMRYENLVSMYMGQEAYAEAKETCAMAYNAMNELGKNRGISWGTILATGDYEWLSDVTKLEVYADLGLAGEALRAGQYENAFNGYREVLPGTLIYGEDVRQQAVKGLEDSAAALADQCIERQDYAGAQAWYDAILNENPVSVEAYLGMSDIRLYQGKVVEACEILDEGVTVGCGKEQLLAEKNYIINNTNMRVMERSSTWRGEDGSVTVKFDDQGRTVQRIANYYGKGEASKYTYDERGNLVCEAYYDDKGNFNYSYLYTYDDANRLIKNEYEYRDGERSSIIYSYYESGTLKEVAETDRNGNSKTKRYREDGKPEGEEYEYNEAGALVKVGDRACNELGFPIYAPDEKGVVDGYHTSFRPVRYIYDENGRIIGDDGGSLYEYDDQNRLIHAHLVHKARELSSYHKILETERAQNFYGFTDKYTGNYWLDVYLTYDDYGRLDECRECITQQKVTYDKVDRYTDEAGLVHLLIGGKIWVLKDYYEDKVNVEKFSYVACEQQERIRSAGSILRELGSFWGIIPNEGLEMAAYYEYRGNWKLAESRESYHTANTISVYTKSVMADTAEEIRKTVRMPWGLAEYQESMNAETDLSNIERDYFGNIISCYDGSDTIQYKYEYFFTGTIE